MNTARTYAILWLSGLIAGVIVMERWRRTGKRLIPTASSTRDDAAQPAGTASSTSSRGTPAVSWILVAGARSDARRAQQFVRRVTPWTTARVPSATELRRWSLATEPTDLEAGPP
jgi:hypothetical protein